MSSSQSHLMKTTRRGRPFVKDTHDLFATLTISLPLETHRNFFKVYPNSFTTDEAAVNLSSLKFSQSNRSADPKDRTRIVTTTTTTTFSMSRDMAKGICQHFMDAQLIENATDLSSNFKERGIYTITPKGLHILERFITKNGITAEHTMRLFAQQPICMKLLHLERRISDDEVIVTKSVIEVLWRRVVGTDPNVSRLSDEELAAQKQSRWYTKAQSSEAEEVDHSIGLVLRKVMKPSLTEIAGSEYHFPALSIIEWLCEFSTCVGPDEAADISAHFVRYGLIILVSDKGRMKEGAIVAKVTSGGGSGAHLQEAEYRATERAIYKITKEGLTVARWNEETAVEAEASSSRPSLTKHDSSSSLNKSQGRSSRSEEPTAASVRSTASPGPLKRRRSLSKRPPSDFSEGIDKDIHAIDSHTARLKHILDEPVLRSLFREFLRANFCEENLSFWLDVQDFKRRFNTTSSAVASPQLRKGSKKAGHLAMEKHQQDLIAMAYVIYNTYLGPASPSELNIDHGLRAELVTYMSKVGQDKEEGRKGDTESGNHSTLHASQLQTTVRLYERIQTYIFRLMATDSVPKFCKTERFLELMRSVFDHNEKFFENDISDLRTQVGGLTIRTDSPEPEDTNERQASPTRAYITISQAANEKQANLLQKKHRIT